MSCLAIAGDGDPMGGELYVRVTDELTATGDTVKPHLPTVLGGAGGKHLCAHDFHEALSGPAGSADAPATAGAPSLSERRRRVVIDTRNHFETAVGSFEGAIDPKIRTFSQFPSWVEANLEQLDGADVYMYCTGGIRCEKASGYLRSLGVAASVNQLAGGIHSYLAAYSDEARAAGVRTLGKAPGVEKEGLGEEEVEGGEEEVRGRQEGVGEEVVGAGAAEREGGEAAVPRSLDEQSSAGKAGGQSGGIACLWRGVT